MNTRLTRVCNHLQCRNISKKVQFIFASLYGRIDLCEGIFASCKLPVQSSIHGDNTFVTCMKGLSEIAFLTDLIVTELM